MLISVKDTGVGIKDEDKGRLFKLFGFVDNTKQLNKNGIGLGLVIAEHITSCFGGNMSFSSIEGRGSKFSFYYRIGSDDISGNTMINFLSHHSMISDIDLDR